MTQTTQECFDEWRSAFCEVLALMDASENLAAASCIAELIESDLEWIQAGAIDGRAFYNDVRWISCGKTDKLTLCDDEDWMAKYFYLKYIEWSRYVEVS